MSTALLLCSFTTLLAVDLPKDEVVLHSDQDQLQGTWKVEKMEFGGNQMLGDAEKMQLIIREDRITASRNGRKEDEVMSFTLESDKDPPAIDMKSTKMKNMTIKGIYRIDGDTLTLCFAPDGERPKKFESKQGTEVVVIVLKREKK